MSVFHLHLVIGGTHGCCNLGMLFPSVCFVLLFFFFIPGMLYQSVPTSYGLAIYAHFYFEKRPVQAIE